MACKGGKDKYRKTAEKSKTEDLNIVPTGVGEDPQAYCVLPIIIRNLKTVRIPIPPLAEQQIIGEEIEKQFSIADKIEKTINQNLKQSDKLKQSILK